MRFDIAHDNDQTVILVPDGNHRIILVTNDNCDIAHMNFSQFRQIQKQRGKVAPDPEVLHC